MHISDLANTTGNGLEHQLISLENQVTNLDKQLVNVSNIVFLKDVDPVLQYFAFFSILLVTLSCFLPCFVGKVVRNVPCMICRLITCPLRSLPCPMYTRRNNKFTEHHDVEEKEDVKFDEKFDDKEQKLIAA